LDGGSRVTTSGLGVPEMLPVVYVRQEEQREFGACSTYCRQLNAATYTAWQATARKTAPPSRGIPPLTGRTGRRERECWQLRMLGSERDQTIRWLNWWMPCSRAHAQMLACSVLHL